MIVKNASNLSQAIGCSWKYALDPRGDAPELADLKSGQLFVHHHTQKINANSPDESTLAILRLVPDIAPEPYSWNGEYLLFSESRNEGKVTRTASISVPNMLYSDIRQWYWKLIPQGSGVIATVAAREVDGQWVIDDDLHNAPQWVKDGAKIRLEKMVAWLDGYKRKQIVNDRLFIGVLATGIGYFDRWEEEDGDYKRLAILFFSDLNLDLRDDCPPELKTIIEDDAASIQARRGEQYQVSGSGQMITLGYALEKIIA